MIVTVTPNPCVDKTVFVDTLTPGAFMRSEKYTCIPGGKGCNVSRAVKSLGRATKALVVVGGHTGAHVVDMIREQDGVECIPVWVKSPTRTITTVLEQSVHRQTAFFEPGSRVTEQDEADIIGAFDAAIAGANVVTFSGTVSDPAIPDLYEKLIPIARNAGVTTILDSHGPEFARGVGAVPYMVKPNLAEARELVGFAIDDRTSQWRAVDWFLERGIELVVLSLGKDGALVSNGKTRFHAIPPSIKEVNPVGSGDALVAGFAIGLMEKLPLQHTARLAIAAGAANAKTWDIGHFEPAEVTRISKEVELLM